MTTIDMVKAGAAVQDKALSEMLEAIRKGDAKGLSRAIKTGSVAAFVVKKGSAIAENPEKYETAAKNVKDAQADLPSMLKSSDALAKAEFITRFSSARRAASALTKVEEKFGKLI